MRAAATGVLPDKAKSGRRGVSSTRTPASVGAAPAPPHAAGGGRRGASTCASSRCSRLRAALSPDPEIRFPGESDVYRAERKRLLEAEIELRRAIERVAAQRRALPRGGALPEDYSFEDAASEAAVRFSELFAPGKETLVLYSFMFPRWPGDTRPAPPGETGELPLAQTPCASCTSILDSLDGAAVHLAQHLNLAVVAKSAPDRIRTFARERGWRNLRLLSSRNNTYNRDYLAETDAGDQRPIVNVFIRDGDEIAHTWASELMFAPREEGMEARHVDSIWPIWNVLDMTPHGRLTAPDFPALDYESRQAPDA